jgi:hypothetical protein
VKRSAVRIRASALGFRPKPEPSAASSDTGSETGPLSDERLHQPIPRQADEDHDDEKHQVAQQADELDEPVTAEMIARTTSGTS